MEIFDRVVLKEDIKMTNGSSVESGTIGTIRQITEHPQNGKTATVQLDYVEEKMKLVPIHLSLLQKVTVEDLDKILTIRDCIKILNPLFHMGCRYVTGDDKRFEISGITLATNELQDLFQVTWLHNGNHDIINRQFIEDSFYYEYKEPQDDTYGQQSMQEQNIKESVQQENVQQAPIQEAIQEDNIIIKINDVEFKFKNDIIGLHNIKREQLGFYIEILLKLNNILNPKN